MIVHLNNVRSAFQNDAKLFLSWGKTSFLRAFQTFKRISSKMIFTRFFASESGEFRVWLKLVYPADCIHWPFEGDSQMLLWLLHHWSSTLKELLTKFAVRTEWQWKESDENCDEFQVNRKISKNYEKCEVYGSVEEAQQCSGCLNIVQWTSELVCSSPSLNESPMINGRQLKLDAPN